MFHHKPSSIIRLLGCPLCKPQYMGVYIFGTSQDGAASKSQRSGDFRASKMGLMSPNNRYYLTTCKAESYLKWTWCISWMLRKPLRFATGQRVIGRSGDGCILVFLPAARPYMAPFGVLAWLSREAALTHQVIIHLWKGRCFVNHSGVISSFVISWVYVISGSAQRRKACGSWGC